MPLTYTPAELEREKRDGNVTANGVVFEWWLISADGAGFALYREPHHTDEDIALAKNLLRNDRDVVKLEVYVPTLRSQRP